MTHLQTLTTILKIKDLTSPNKRSVGNWLIWTHKKTLITLKVIIWRNPVCDCLRLLHTPIVSLLYYFSYSFTFFYLLNLFSFSVFFITDSINTCVTTYVTIVVQIQKPKKKKKKKLFVRAWCHAHNTEMWSRSRWP